MALLAVSGLPISRANATVWQYAARPGAELELQLPAGAGPFPVFIAVHGGGWESGSRRDALPFCRIVLEAGFACAAVDYRLAPGARFPAAVDDIRAAVAFLRSRSGQFKISPDQFILAGESAGGHLAAVAAIRSGGEQAIAGVMVFSGPFDLVAMSAPSRLLNVVPDQISQLLGIHRWNEGTVGAMKAASPTFLLTAKAPPFLVIRGAEDRLVPAGQARSFCEKAEALGVACTITTIPNARHDLWSETEMDRFGTLWSGAVMNWARGILKVRAH